MWAVIQAGATTPHRLIGPPLLSTKMQLFPQNLAHFTRTCTNLGKPDARLRSKVIPQQLKKIQHDQACKSLDLLLLCVISC